jgi:opacity protein-like surface antigen
MLKLATKSCFALTLAASSAFAGDILSTFNQQGDVDYPTPFGQEEYFAKQVPMLSRPSGYFGVDFGPNLTSLASDVKVNNIPSQVKRKDVISYGIGAYGGYGTNFSHLYLGAELYWYYNFLDKKIPNIVPPVVGGYKVEVKVNQPLAVGIDIIPGYLTESKKVLFYGRLGLGVSFIKLKFTDITDTTVINPPSDKINKFVFGLRAGTGMEYFVSDNFSLRTEYTYVGYNKVSGDDKTVDGTSYSYKLGGTGSHQIKLGLSIHF